jgi:hypothetical protein
MAGHKSPSPVAEIGDEDYCIVRHTHDVDLAKQLMRGKWLEVNGCPGGPDFSFCVDESKCEHAPDLGEPRQVHVRILPALPGSHAELEGWKFEYRECEPKRGAFRAVVFGGAF